MESRRKLHGDFAYDFTKISLFWYPRTTKGSALITTNLVFSAWSRIFKDPMTTLAAVDRVVHHSVILDMAGVESFRATQAREAHTLSETTLTGTTVVPTP